MAKISHLRRISRNSEFKLQPLHIRVHCLQQSNYAHLIELHHFCDYKQYLILCMNDKIRKHNKLQDWLPRRVMSAWRVAGIVHCLEEWNEHECGYNMINMDKVWPSALKHGFKPLTVPLKK